MGYMVCNQYPELIRCYVACNIAHLDAFTKAQETSWTQRFKSWYMLFFQVKLVKIRQHVSYDDCEAA